MGELTRVHYRPIEAAIRWSDLLRHEEEILSILGNRSLSTSISFPAWPTLNLNIARIYDGLLNRDLRPSINGIATRGALDFGNPELTIRHVDLKAWMEKYYPDQRPEFLFDRIERETHPAITLDAVHGLLMQREWLRSQIEERDRVIVSLKNQIGVKPSNRDPAQPLSPRSEAAYQNILGSMLGLLTGRAPSGQPYSSFRTQESVISALVANYGGRLGISESTLEAKFAAAKRALSRE